MSMSNAMTMARNRNFGMAAVEATPGSLFPHVYNRLTDAETHLRRGERGFWRLKLPHRSVRVFRPQDALRITHIGSDPERRVYDRYTMPDAFEPAPTDTVVDVGAFIGEFSWWVQQHRRPGELVIVEPDPRSVFCLNRNIGDGARIEQVAAGDVNVDNIVFNLADDPSESGVLMPDKGDFKRWGVNQRRLDVVVDEVDFLKVEAEGFEPEILRGLGDLEPPKVVVNVSPERGGESTAPACIDILTDRGYDTYRDGEELFAWLK